ncbi:hypothetical protein B484DRAFT_407109 [Ochromonadaceae sp. CCMP2298]|nr:hypothetical protein B484DRAFT_407109 [Ochromonadaceae sp. CCMP2298]
MGYKNNFTVKNMFQQTGNLRGTDYITLVTVMMDYIVYISNNIPDAYKCFYLSFGNGDRSQVGGRCQESGR